MKRIVPKILIISSQILLGALFLMVSIHSKSEVNFKVNSKEMDKLSWAVYNSGEVLVKAEEQVVKEEIKE